MITKGVMNTCFAKLYMRKVIRWESDILSVDAQPSGAINLANRCNAPIYFLPIVSPYCLSYSSLTVGCIFSSAADGPDLLSKELELVRNIDLAVKEDRYDDAAMWRDKLMKLCYSQDDH
ncbi:hypothetical protein SLE2022_009340 [Rubroshorea leprosula]